MTLDWADLYERYTPYLRACTRGLSPDTAEEILAEAWAVIYQKIGDLRDPAKFRFWAASITARLAAREHNRSKRFQTFEADDDGEIWPYQLDAAPTPEEAAVVREQRAVMDGALSRLPKTQQAVLRCLAEGLSYEETAARLGISAGSVGPLKQRAVQRLQERMSA